MAERQTENHKPLAVQPAGRVVSQGLAGPADDALGGERSKWKPLLVVVISCCILRESFERKPTLALSAQESQKGRARVTVFWWPLLSSSNIEAWKKQFAALSASVEVLKRRILGTLFRGLWVNS